MASSKLDSFLSFVDKVAQGIDLIKSISDITNEDENYSLPNFPSNEEAVDLLHQSNDSNIFEVATYCIIADSVKSYADYLVKYAGPNGGNSDEIAKASLPYIARIYFDITCVLKSCCKIKMRAKNRGSQLSYLEVAAKLLCQDDSLKDSSFDFLSDVAELLDMCLMITDSLGINQMYCSFGDLVKRNSEQICDGFENLKYLSYSVSERERKKALKAHIKCCNNYADTLYVGFTRAYYKLKSML